MLSATLFTLSFAATAFADHHGQLAKRHHHIAHRSLQNRDGNNAPFTYYATGLGACGIVNNDQQFIVALNSQDFGSGYPGPNCFKTVTIQIGDKTARATITDECPGCYVHGPHGLDMAPALFEHFADESVGVLYGSWWYDGGYDAAGQGPPQNTGGSSGSGGGGSSSGSGSGGGSGGSSSQQQQPSSTYYPPSSTIYSFSYTPPKTTSTTKTTHSTTPTTTTSKTSTTVKLATTSKSSTSISTTAIPTPSVPAVSPNYGATIENIFKAYVYMDSMVAFAASAN